MVVEKSETAKSLVDLTGGQVGRTTMDAVARMVEEGNITKKDAIRHAEALNQVWRFLLDFHIQRTVHKTATQQVKVRKRGDAQRILLMNMVKVRWVLYAGAEQAQ